MGQPLALSEFHMVKGSHKRRILRTAGVDTESDSACSLLHMAHPHLREILTVLGAFYAIIILPAAEAVPHGFHLGGDGGGGRW